LSKKCMEPETMRSHNGSAGVHAKLLTRQEGECAFGYINYIPHIHLQFPKLIGKGIPAESFSFQVLSGASGVVHCFYAMGRLSEDEKSGAMNSVMVGLDSCIQACIASIFSRGWLSVLTSAIIIADLITIVAVSITVEGPPSQAPLKYSPRSRARYFPSATY
jgi:hypothetical protein